MEILGHTVSGKIIVVVSQEEWNSLQSGVKPLDDHDYNEMSKRELEFPETPIGQVLLTKFKGRRGKTPIHYAYIKGELDGTIENLIEWLSGRYIRNVSNKSRALLVQALREALAANARPSHP